MSPRCSWPPPPWLPLSPWSSVVVPLSPCSRHFIFRLVLKYISLVVGCQSYHNSSGGCWPARWGSGGCWSWWRRRWSCRCPRRQSRRASQSWGGSWSCSSNSVLVGSWMGKAGQKPPETPSHDLSTIAPGENQLILGSSCSYLSWKSLSLLGIASSGFQHLPLLSFIPTLTFTFTFRRHFPGWVALQHFWPQWNRWWAREERSMMTQHSTFKYLLTCTKYYFCRTHNNGYARLQVKRLDMEMSTKVVGQVEK